MSRRPIDVDELARIIDPGALAPVANESSALGRLQLQRRGKAYEKAARVIAYIAGCLDLSRGPMTEDAVSLRALAEAYARAALDRAAIERRGGLQMMLGGAGAIARAMGPNDDLAKVFAGPVDVMVHEACAADLNHLLELMPNAPSEGV